MNIKYFFLTAFTILLTLSQLGHSAAVAVADPKELFIPIAAIKKAFAIDLEKRTIPSWPPMSRELVLEGQKYKVSINFESEVTIPKPFERKPFDGPTLNQVLFSLGENLKLYHAFDIRGEYTSPPVWSYKCGFDATPTTYKEGTIEKIGYGRWGTLEFRYSRINSALIEPTSDDESEKDKTLPTYLTDFYISLTKA